MESDVWCMCITDINKIATIWPEYRLTSKCTSIKLIQNKYKSLQCKSPIDSGIILVIQMTTVLNSIDSIDYYSFFFIKSKRYYSSYIQSKTLSNYILTKTMK